MHPDGGRRPSEVMAALGILQLGDPRLTTPARELRFPGDEREAARVLQRLSGVADAVLRAHTFSAGAMGLAAPQIGEPVALALFRPANAPQIVLVNPVVVEAAPADPGAWEEATEGCLSFFDFRCLLRRPKRIVVRYRTLIGEPRETVFDEGRVARDLLHEIDHLGGVLCLDHAERGRPSAFVV
ncbi:peptide deformylase [Dactylosporangium sp. NPDC051485]|uniref:peptide deformylase n=1 Tax=Dactylosporangium sp. NPDC051485 TaxID=3154846 RepID=UPI003412C445